MKWRTKSLEVEVVQYNGNTEEIAELAGKCFLGLEAFDNNTLIKISTNFHLKIEEGSYFEHDVEEMWKGDYLIKFPNGDLIVLDRFNPLLNLFEPINN